MKGILKIAGLLALFFLATFAVAVAMGWMEEQAVRHWLQSLHQSPAGFWWVAAAIIGILMIDLLLPVPGGPVMILAGHLLGPVAGTLISTIGGVAGGAVGYYACRLGGRRVLHHFVPSNEVPQVRRWFDQYGFVAVMLARAVPILPEVIACVAGLARMKQTVFFLAFTLATFVFAAAHAVAGAYSTMDNPWLAIIVGLAVPTIGWLSWRGYTRQPDKPTRGPLDFIFEVSPDLLGIYTSDGRFVQINPAWELTLGYPLTSLTGTPFIHLVHPLDVPDTLKQMDRIRAGEHVVDFINRYRHRNGEYRWLEWRALPIQDGLIYAAARDITERYRTHQQLHDSERRYRLLFENMVMAFVMHEMVYDPQGRPVDYRFLEVNPAFEKLTGLTSDQVVGKTLLELAPDIDPVWIQTAARVTETGKPEAIAAFSPLSKSHLEGWVFRKAPGRFASMFVDVTDRKRAEESRELLMAELDHRVRNNLATVMSLAQQTAATTGGIDEFLSVFNGRLRTMVTGHHLLAESNWRGINARQAIEQMVAPYTPASDRLTLNGPDIAIPTAKVQCFCLVINELSTNAVRHGAWSGAKGVVDIAWHRDGSRMHLDWRERHGPPVDPEATPGCGIDLMTGLIEQEARGTIVFDFQPAGLHVMLHFNIDHSLL